MTIEARIDAACEYFYDVYSDDERERMRGVLEAADEADAAGSWNDTERPLADSPRGEAQRAAVAPDLDGIGQALGESFYLSSQGMSEWPTLDECVAAGKRAAKEIAGTLTDAATWRAHICAVPPGDGRVVVMHRDRYDELTARADAAGSWNDTERLRTALTQARTTISFFASVIKSGEPWTRQCENEMDQTRAAIDAALAESVPSPPAKAQK